MLTIWTIAEWIANMLVLGVALLVWIGVLFGGLGLIVFSLTLYDRLKRRLSV